MPPSPNDSLPVNPEWEVHPAQVKQWLDAHEDFLLLDIRRLPEWNAARIDRAVFIPMHELPARLAEIEPWKTRRVVVQCHHGVRSLNVTAFLRQQGFTETHSMAGGIEAYSQLADPTVPRY